MTIYLSIIGNIRSLWFYTAIAYNTNILLLEFIIEIHACQLNQNTQTLKIPYFSVSLNFKNIYKMLKVINIEKKLGIIVQHK